MKKICLDGWIYNNLQQKFTLKNINQFPALAFNKDNTFTIIEKFRSKEAIAVGRGAPKKFDDIEKRTQGTWRIDINPDNKRLILNFTDENQGNSSNSEKGSVVLQYATKESNILTCIKTHSYRILKDFKIVKQTDEAFLEIKALSQCQIYKGTKERAELAKLLPEGFRMRDYLYASRVEAGSQKSAQDYVREFHDKCDGHSTLILAKSEEGKIFGAFTDISWTNSGSIPKKNLGRSFIFVENDPSQNENDRRLKPDDEGGREPFCTFKVKQGMPETYHSEHFGPDFLELKLNAPTELSLFKSHSKSYQMPLNVVTSA